MRMLNSDRRVAACGVALSLVLAAAAGTASAKLPPVSDDAKAKAAEATAKTAHGGKVADFQLCKSMDKVAAQYAASSKKAGKDTKPATPTPACADPGAFVYPPPDPNAPATAAKPAAPAATVAAAAAAAKPAPKKP